MGDAALAGPAVHGGLGDVEGGSEGGGTEEVVPADGRSSCVGFGMSVLFAGRPQTRQDRAPAMKGVFARVGKEVKRCVRRQVRKQEREIIPVDEGAGAEGSAHHQREQSLLIRHVHRKVSRPRPGLEWQPRP